MLFNFIMFLTLAQGLNIIYGFTGYLPFGYVGFFGAGAYGFALAVMHLHAPALVAHGRAAPAPRCVLAVILLPLLRLSGAYFAIANLAAAQAVYRSRRQPGPGGHHQGPLRRLAVRRVRAGACPITSPSPSWPARCCSSSGCATPASACRCRRSGTTPVSAAMAGVSVVRGRTIAWLLSALIAGPGGRRVRLAHLGVLPRHRVRPVSISIFSTVFLLFGGATTLTGPLLGVFILYGIYNVIGIAVPQYFQFTYGALIVLLVLFLPNGLVSLLTSRGIRVP